MITVYVNLELIEQLITTGAEFRHTRVKEGLPEGAKLLSAGMVARPFISEGILALYFSDPEPGSDREMNITFETMEPKHDASGDLLS